MTVAETLNILNAGPILGDVAAGVPAMVWVIEHEVFSYRAERTIPIKGSRNLVWALMKANSVTKTDGGIRVDFWGNRSRSWFPKENVCLPDNDCMFSVRN